MNTEWELSSGWEEGIGGRGNNPSKGMKEEMCMEYLGTNEETGLVAGLGVGAGWQVLLEKRWEHLESWVPGFRAQNYCLLEPEANVPSCVSSHCPGAIIYL